MEIVIFLMTMLISRGFSPTVYDSGRKKNTETHKHRLTVPENGGKMMENGATFGWLVYELVWRFE